MGDTGRAVEQVPALQRPFFALDDEHAVTVEEKEVLLLALAVIHRHRLARLQDVQVDAELLESGVVALEAAVLAERAVGPLGVSGVEHEPVGHDWSSGSSAPSGVGSDMSS